MLHVCSEQGRRGYKHGGDSPGMKENIKLCIAGASGLVGSSIVRAALERGYSVNGTLRDKSDSEKSLYLKRLLGGERLELFTAEMANGSSFDLPLMGADAVFIACLIPTYKGPSGTLALEMDLEQGYAEIIKPTVDGCLNILRSAQQNGVNKAVICSSTSSTNPSTSVPFKNEVEHWSDENEQCRVKKYTSATKTIMEKAAIRFAQEHGIRLSIMLPTGLYGKAVLPTHMNHNPFAWLARVIDGGYPHHKQVPNSSVSMIHLQDLADLFLAAYENSDASGRYFGVYDSLHWKDIYAECHKILPNMLLPDPITEPPVIPTGFDFTRRDSLGVHIRDFPTLLRQTIEWIQSRPFQEKNRSGSQEEPND